MATPEQIEDLRSRIDEPVSAVPWTDDVLAVFIDSSEGDLNSAAASVWTRKASSLASLTDVKEGNSDRALSKLYKQALEMSQHYGNLTEVVVTSARRSSRTRKIERQ